MWPEGLDPSTWLGQHRRGPLNVMLHCRLPEVVGRLEEAGWRRTRAQSRQVVWQGRGRRQDVDLVQGSWWGRRLHIRLWDLHGLLVGQAHDEQRTWRGPLPGHRVLSQDSGRDAVAALFSGHYAPAALPPVHDPRRAAFDGRVFVGFCGPQQPTPRSESQMQAPPSRS